MEVEVAILLVPNRPYGLCGCKATLNSSLKMLFTGTKSVTVGVGGGVGGDVYRFPFFFFFFFFFFFWWVGVGGGGGSLIVLEYTSMV